MIGWLRGRLSAKTPPSLVIDVNGVGYECEAPMSTFYTLPATGSEVTLRTHLVVREDAHILYAFSTDEERRLFRGLLKVTGIGPKIALAILSGMSVDVFLRCIEAEDVAPLVRIPGVGRKTAERLLIDMRDRVRDLGDSHAAFAPHAPGETSAQHEAYSALLSLGYKPAEVTRLLKSVDEPNATTEELIRHALKSAAIS
jgi:Holliday junction DNA helicase RuvA